MVASATPGAAENSGVIYHWYEDAAHTPSTWADYFRQNAQIVLGPERRLPNGVSWRLQTDRSTGIAYPRLTWMPDRKRLLAANRLLDGAHGAELLVEHDLEDGRERLNRDSIALHGEPATLYSGPILEQWNVDLTYVGKRLMSAQTSAFERSGGTHPTVYLRGLTFDLQAETIVELGRCPGRPTDIYAGPFRYGELLDLCDTARYHDFIALVRSIDARNGRRHITWSEPNKMLGCVESPDQPVFREDQEYVVYLTFAGLAVQAAGDDCPIKPTPDNPVIVPYRELAPFMTPGPWRDELLALP